ncbi:alpha/beta fold hydrolase [Nocardia sp. NPDC051832]|uniref:alpha/beta hydrolase family protein n=1 Tax=Nocardia sp. NPDC051832 TaxID=3155673 RepID=UPI00343F214A
MDTPTIEWQPADYADPATFEEWEVTLGAGEYPVPGTVTMPRGAGPRPAVVLLAGGGPFDRDATVGPNKSLKDIAWGLATRGIAVLRFDKVTMVHPEAFWASSPTMADEYVPYAVSAIELLSGLPGVDQVFVVGHSMGGKAAPRVAAAAPAVAGLVILSGDTQPMQWSMVRVVRHLTEVDPESAAALPPVQTVIEQAKRVDSPELSRATPPEDLPFGAPGSYWLDLRSYDPVATAAALDTPMFIAQGGRDYQVTVADDLAGWQAGLADRSDVTIRVYEADDHMLFPGGGPSLPADYARPQHVDPELIADIADWVTTVRNH